MRSVGAFFALMVTLTLVISGCLQVPEGDDGETTLDDGPDDGPGDGGDDGDPADGDDGGDGDPGDDGEGGDEGGGDDEERELECHEHDRPQPAHPDNHSVSSDEDLLCPGQYLIRDEGSGESWETPTWSVGDWWYYEHESYTGAGTQCSHHSKETVVEDDTVILGVPVYTIETRYYDCDGEESGQTATMNRSQHSLMAMQESGFIEHHLVFPLQEGKSWTFVANSCSDGECNRIDVDEVGYSEGGGVVGSLEVWTSQWTIESERGTVEVDQQWSVKHRALHYEEMNHDAIPGPLLTKELTDSSYHDEDDDDPLSGPL